eukprot:TRINITY_DN11129_c0_g1_i1.p1 TRINITY_DN11129_c0_g1~~TRINITY_DN11129_c0_g1_i1.p1  ORF type:complete len:413 (+),score=83.73 TRINITY_DN11129_c0_g1_i1:36-1241(+)
MNRGAPQSQQEAMLTELKKMVSENVTDRRDAIDKIIAKRKTLDATTKRIGGEKFLKPQTRDLKAQLSQRLSSLKSIEALVENLNSEQDASINDKLHQLRQIASTTSSGDFLKEIAFWERVCHGDSSFESNFDFSAPLQFSRPLIQHPFWFHSDSLSLNRYLDQVNSSLRAYCLSKTISMITTRNQLEECIPIDHSFYNEVLNKLIRSTQRKVKIHHNDVIRVTTASPNDSFENVEQSIGEFLGIQSGTGFDIRYKDCSGDLIDVKTTAEWVECWSHFEAVIVANSDRQTIDDRLVIFVSLSKSEPVFQERPSTTLLPQCSQMVPDAEQPSSKWEIDPSLSLRTVASEATTIHPLSRQRSSSSSSLGRQRGVLKGRPTPGRVAAARQSAPFNSFKVQGRGMQ